MESETTVQSIPQEAKGPWNRVTPLSKYLAMALFITLPFAGFWVGSKYSTVSTPLDEDMVGQEYERGNQGASNTSNATGDTSSAPAIQSQTLFGEGDNPAYLLPGKPTVTTTSGQSIQLELLMEIPPAKKGIYSYGNVLYSYDMETHAFALLPGGDAATFETLPGAFSFDQYAKDKANVYCNGEILAGADTMTFKAIPDWESNMSKYLTSDEKYIYYQDKSHQYVYGECAAMSSTNQ